MSSELGEANTNISEVKTSEIQENGNDSLDKTNLDSLEAVFEADRNTDGYLDKADADDGKEGTSFKDEFSKGNELSGTEKAAILAEHPGRSEKSLENTRIDENGNELIMTNNSELEGKEVKDANGNVAGQYQQESYDDGNGKKLTGVFLHFNNPIARVELPESKEHSANSVQFNECNQQLKSQLDKNPEMKTNFNEKQLDALFNNDYQHPTIPGLVWHHQPEDGKMVLVDAVVHHNAHTGGNALWGGGTDGTYSH